VKFDKLCYISKFCLADDDTILRLIAAGSCLVIGLVGFFVNVQWVVIWFSVGLV
jgi:hypothetical protein